VEIIISSASSNSKTRNSLTMVETTITMEDLQEIIITIILGVITILGEIIILIMA